MLRDGQHLLAAVGAATAPPWLGAVPAVALLRQVGHEQFVADEHGGLRWRAADEMPASPVASPYDAEARYSTKRAVDWVGDKVHLTETCDAGRPHVITDVQTTPANTTDDVLLGPVQESLAARELLPAEPLADKGYVNAGALVASAARGVELVGPVACSPGWQARQATGFDKSRFVVDWERQVVTCPAGQQSALWRPFQQAHRAEAWEVRFSPRDCGPCPHRAHCTTSKTGRRELRLLPRAQHEALARRRAEQETAPFRQRCRARAGIEATHEQAVRRAGLRQSRYVGLAKTHLQHVLTALALNVVRIADWWQGKPPAPTRVSVFARLQPMAAS